MSENGFSGPTKERKKAEKELPIGMENIPDNEEFREGILFFEEQEYIEALDIFSSILMEQRDDYARLYLARCYHRLEKSKIAYKHYSFLSESSSLKMREYGKSMLAALEVELGDYGRGIRILRSMPKNTNMSLNLCLLYWRKYKVENDELALHEALKILNSLNIELSKTNFIKRFHHTKAIIYQAQKTYSLAEVCYQEALKFAENDISRGRILNDYASLHIECSQYDEAEKMLDEVISLVEDKSEVQKAFYNKWMGILERKRQNFTSAKIYLEKALKLIKEHDLVQEAAEVSLILAEFAQKDGKDFSEVADYYADGLIHVRKLKEVTSNNEKINDFYYDNLLGSDNDDSDSC